MEYAVRGHGRGATGKAGPGDKAGVAEADNPWGVCDAEGEGYTATPSDAHQSLSRAGLTPLPPHTTTHTEAHGARRAARSYTAASAQAQAGSTRRRWSVRNRTRAWATPQRTDPGRRAVETGQGTRWMCVHRI